MSRYVHLLKEDFAIPAGAKIIKAQEFGAWTEANEMLASARQRADEINADAESAYAAERKRGHQQGLDEGTAEIAERLLATTQMTIDYLATVEQQMTETVTVAVRKILGEYHNRDLTLSVVRQALASMRNETKVTIRVSPEGAEQLQATLSRDFSDIDFIDVVPDHTLASGACVLESAAGVLDASIDVQIAAIERYVRARFGSARPLG